MSDPLFDQADALMRRRRVFVAGKAATDTGSDARADAGADDVPVLTEAVELAPPPPEPDLEAMAQALLPGLLEEQRQVLMQEFEQRRKVLMQEIETWLDEQLPQLVIRAMDGITDHLVTVLTLNARENLLPRLDAMLRADDGGQESDAQPE